MMLPLPPGWLCLQDCNLSGQFGQPVVVPFVLMHPDVGVALIDLAPASNPDAESVLRRRLEAARFESIFSGFLPILHLRLDRADLPSTETILRDAFAALPRLSVPGGDGWVNVVRRALLPRDLGRAAPHSAGPPGAAAGRAGRPAAQPYAAAGRAPGRPAAQPYAAGGRPAAQPHAAAEDFGLRDQRRPGRDREAEMDLEMLRREVAARAAITPPSETGGQPAPASLPEPTIRASHPLPWIIMAGVGGLIAMLALVGLINTGADTRDSAEEGRAAPASTTAQPVTPPAPPPLAAPVAPVPSQGSAASPPRPPTTAPAPPAPAPSPGSVATLPRPPTIAPAPIAPAPAPAPVARPPAAATPSPPPPPDASSAASGAGASATPAPAQRPAPPAPPAATERVPRVVVRQPANLRAGPDGQANIIRVAPRGETLRVHGRTGNGWVLVGDTEPRGWIHNSRLGEAE